MLRKVLIAIGVLAVLGIGGCGILTVGVLIGTSGDSGGGSSPAQPGSEGGSGNATSSNEKAVKVVVSATGPVDVSIMDDNFDANLGQEQQGGTKTYKFTVAKSSGMLIDVTTPDLSGNADIHVEVYEDGKLVAEDNDPSYVQIMY